MGLEKGNTEGGQRRRVAPARSVIPGGNVKLGLSRADLLSVPQPAHAGLMPRDRFLYFAICFYLICHSFTIPVFATKMAWASWPRLDDFATVLLLAAAALSHRRAPLPPGWSKFSRLLIVANFLTLVRFLFMAFFERVSDFQIQMGLYQVVRLAEYSAVFFFACRLTASDRPLRLFWRVIMAIWGFVIAIGICNFLEIVPASAMVSHLLADPGSAGSWARVSLMAPNAVIGPLGWNYFYLANQITLLGIFLVLGRPSRLLTRAIVLGLSFLVIFLGGSRAGLAAFSCAVVLGALARRRRLGGAVLISAGVLYLVLVLSPGSWLSSGGEVLDRHIAFTHLDDETSYSGRVDIWLGKLYYIRDAPLVLLYGLGWGGISLTGKNAHMLPLHVLMETGVMGLAFFVTLFIVLLRAQWRSGTMGKGLAVATAGLLVAAVTQETFYPLPASGSFLGLYFALCGVVAANAGAPEPGRITQSGSSGPGGVHLGAAQREVGGRPQLSWPGTVQRAPSADE